MGSNDQGDKDGKDSRTSNGRDTGDNRADRDKWSGHIASAEARLEKLKSQHEERVAKAKDRLSKALPNLDAKIGSVMVPARARLATTVAPVLNLRLPPLPELEDITAMTSVSAVSLSPIVQNWAKSLEDARGAAAIWSELEAGRRLATFAGTDLSEADRQGAAEMHLKHFNQHGLLGPKALGETLGKVSQELGAGLQTTLFSPEGDAVRRQLNRGFVAYASSTDAVGQAEAMGVAALALGADAAFAAGATVDGEALLKIAATAADVALGILPATSVANDLAQIVHGAVTGFDYAGNPMAASDYVFRTIGVMVGALPGGGLVAKASEGLFRLGKTQIDLLFYRGADAIRSLGAGAAFAHAMSRLKGAQGEVAGKVAKFVGKNFPEMEELAERQKTILRLELDAVSSKLGSFDIEAVMNGAEANRALGVRVAAFPASSEVWRTTISQPTTAYRVHRMKQGAKAQWMMLVNPKNLSKAEIASRFALPGKAEGVAFVSKIEIPAGAKAYVGPVSANEWGQGGGLQVVAPEIEDAWLRSTEAFE